MFKNFLTGLLLSFSILPIFVTNFNPSVPTNNIENQTEIRANNSTTPVITTNFLDWIKSNLAIVITVVSIFFTLLVILLLYIIKVNKDRKHMNEKLFELNKRDQLTGLFNKVEFEKQAEKRIVDKIPFCISVIDIDNFKSINDTYGHLAGDGIIKSVASILQSYENEKLSAYRFGGDEFVLVFESSSAEEIKMKINTISREIYNKASISQSTNKVTSSIGVSCYPKDGNNLKEIVYKADLSLYYVKDSGKNNIEFFSSEKLYSNSLRSDMIERLKTAIMNNDVYMVYQPQVDIRTNKVIVFEALMRIKNFEYGPSDFIAVAEKSGLILQLGRIAVVQAIEFLDVLKSEGLNDIKVSVNFSGIQINDSKYFDLLDYTLSKHNLDYKNLKIEMTESSLFENNINFKNFLKNVYERKIQLDLDDFGSGYSSISNLSKYHFDTIKFDKDVVENSTFMSSIVPLIDFVHSLNYTVLVEGVENEEQMKTLKAFGCDVIQGYYFSKPLGDKEAVEYAKQYS